ncbi:hypothetical protein DL1_07135 [Thioclava dalianensis]|uniref:Uncharacterized protein n=1 Tax=Thioclava dalianensis TaxID=1185766 RepID=A0A074TR58_9RHOB|nr:hypothetical protein [Thioclava dalianensis]KEP71453.1 hypothetical protein DL1_07135 [Thioclava dalianensis]SFM78232.1 hypothetical protein SAMN05216224_101274 [Thioclava dalianensis]
MTRNSVYTALAAFALAAGTAGVASAETSQYGVIAPPMYVHSVASDTATLGATNQGKTQLAAQLQTFAGLGNINPDSYSANELQNILRAARDGDISQVNFYVNHENRLPGGPGVGATNQGKTQLAEELNLNPTDFTQAQLERINQSAQNDNMTDVSYVIDNATAS